MAVKDVLGSKSKEQKKQEYPWNKKRGMGTSISEYSEAGPFSCGMCWYLKSTEPRKDPQGLCGEPHMLKDPDIEKVKVEGQTFAVVNKQRGCCRFIDPVKPSEPKKEFMFAGDSEEESQEHEELLESEKEEKEEHEDGKESEEAEEHEHEEEED